MWDFFDKALAKLGWNGKKTVRGVVMTVIGLIIRYALHKEVDPMQLDLALVLLVNILLNLSDLLTLLGVPLASLGFVHKIVKWLKPDDGGDGGDDDGTPKPFVRRDAPKAKWE